MPLESTNIKIDSQVKKECKELYSRFGLSLGTAINMFLRQSLMEQGIPFRVRVPEKGWEATKAAIEEVKLMKADPALGKTYTDVDAMMEDLLSDEV